jgi:hypothetical protein
VSTLGLRREGVVVVSRAGVAFQPIGHELG